MLTCKEIAYILASKEELNLLKRTEIKMHLLICKYCSNYNKQLTFLEKGIQQLFKEKIKIDSSNIESLKKEIIKQLLKSKE